MIATGCVGLLQRNPQELCTTLIDILIDILINTLIDQQRTHTMKDVASLLSRIKTTIRRSDDNSYATLVKHQKTIHVDHSTKTLSVGGDEIIAELPLSEDDVSLLWYLLVNASNELSDEVDEADHYNYLLEHIAREDVASLLSRISELEAVPGYALTEAP